jgi:hypothetical protein
MELPETVEHQRFGGNVITPHFHHIYATTCFSLGTEYSSISSRTCAHIAGRNPTHCALLGKLQIVDGVMKPLLLQLVKTEKTRGIRVQVKDA